MTAPLDYEAHINRHYTPGDLAEAILAGLRAAGKDPARLGPEDLAPVDQFHTRGKPATVELARAPGMQVLDVGGGLGGPARTLAAEFGCRVTVLDITREYCRVGEALTERTGLGERVTFRCASALDMPFADESFDVVRTQHSNMNIGDKERLYGESRRVLRPGRLLALHEIMAGPNQPPHFPVPWAADPALSFIRPAADVRALIERSGFAELAFHDQSETARAWFRERLASLPGAAAARPASAARRDVPAGVRKCIAEPRGGSGYGYRGGVSPTMTKTRRRPRCPRSVSARRQPLSARYTILATCSNCSRSSSPDNAYPTSPSSQ